MTFIGSISNHHLKWWLVTKGIVDKTSIVLLNKARKVRCITMNILSIFNFHDFNFNLVFQLKRRAEVVKKSNEEDLQKLESILRRPYIRLPSAYELPEEFVQFSSWISDYVYGILKGENQNKTEEQLQKEIQKQTSLALDRIEEQKLIRLDEAKKIMESEWSVKTELENMLKENSIRIDDCQRAFDAAKAEYEAYVKYKKAKRAKILETLEKKETEEQNNGADEQNDEA